MPKIWIYVVETETIAIASIDMVPSSCACSKADHLYPSIHAKSGNASQSVTLQIDVTNFPISLRLPTDRPTQRTNEPSNEWTLSIWKRRRRWRRLIRNTFANTALNVKSEHIWKSPKSGSTQEHCSNNVNIYSLDYNKNKSTMQLAAPNAWNRFHSCLVFHHFFLFLLGFFFFFLTGYFRLKIVVLVFKINASVHDLLNTHKYSLFFNLYLLSSLTFN